MDRRSFLKKLGIGAAAVATVAVAPSLIEHSIGMGPTDEPYVSASDTMLEYADYSNFSSFATQASMDDLVSDAAKQLGHQAGLSVQKLWEAQFG